MTKPKTHIIGKNIIIKKGKIIDYEKLSKFLIPEEEKQNILNQSITKNQVDQWINLMTTGSNKDMKKERTLINLNIEKVEKSWKLSKNYLSDDFEKILIKNKYIHSRKNLINNQVLRAPQIFINNGQIEFLDGRHRFSNIRDLKLVQTMPFEVQTSQLEIFKCNFV